MKIKWVKNEPLTQRYRCSICKKLKWGVSDIDVAYTDGRLICYECNKDQKEEVKNKVLTPKKEDI